MESHETSAKRKDEKERKRKKEQVKSEKVELVKATERNIGEVRSLNLIVFPLTFPEKFYRDQITLEKCFCRIGFLFPFPCREQINGFFQAIVEGEFAGAICCEINRVENVLVVQAIAVCLKNRRQGVGKKLMEEAVEFARVRSVERVQLHVQSSNEEAMSFYSKQGFKKTKLLSNFYKNKGLKPPHAYLYSYCLSGEQEEETLELPEKEEKSKRKILSNKTQERREDKKKQQKISYMFAKKK